MNLLILCVREMTHRWKSSAVVTLVVLAITAAVTYFSVNNAGFQKELSRNARDIGSNVVILPAELDQQQYHFDGGYSDITMSGKLVEQLIEYKASLNHLIPMLERKTDCSLGDRTATARVVGISASIPMPGRPRAPMQKSLEKGSVQLGSALAESLGIGRDATPEIMIAGKSVTVARVNRSNGTWQDGAAFVDLKTAQALFALPDQISRIEAIECTDEQCAATGLKSNVVLANELARVTDAAVIFRKDKMANARLSIRTVGVENQALIQGVLWVLLAISIAGLSSLNFFQRKSEVGVLLAVGYDMPAVVNLFVLRTALLTSLGSAIGVCVGAWVAWSQSLPLFVATGKKFSIDWEAVGVIGFVAVGLAMLASAIPAMFAARRDPADVIGKDR
jgi:ABC-type lipoprotein release transport system permease subunit